MKISEILHKAADEHLWDGENLCGPLEYPYSCDAIRYGVCSGNEFGAITFDAIRFLKHLGVDTFSSNEFNDFYTYKERQGARYFWLKFAS